MFRIHQLRLPNVCTVSLTATKRHKATTWHEEKKRILPSDIAIKHFDTNYSKVYGKKWPSIRLGLLMPNKHAAILNPMCDNQDQVEHEMKLMRKVDLKRYYEKHWRAAQRFKKRMSILQTKKDSCETDSTLSEGGKTETTLSDLETGFSSAAEDAQRLFESEFEDNDLNRRIVHRDQGSLVLNEFVPSSELIYQEESVLVSSGESNLFKYDDSLQVTFADEPKLNFDDQLRIFTNGRGVIGFSGLTDETQKQAKSGNEIHEFPHPKLHPKINLWNYYVLDLASILPPLLLDVRPGNVVADYCAAPGGKALCTLFSSLSVSKLVLNEPSQSRAQRLQSVFAAYVGRNGVLRNCLEFSQIDGRKLIRPDQFDRVLLDVPCSNDRLSVQQNQNSLFSNSRMKERISLPDTQTDLLCAGLRSLKLNGTLVYSTCSLSPVQNDAVVQDALTRLAAQSRFRFEVRRLKESLRPFRGLLRMHHFNYGEQVIPFVPSNAGPLYICKLIRVE